MVFLFRKKKQKGERSMKYLDEKMANRLRGLMAESGKSMEAVAQEMKITRATLSSRINGRRDFTRVEMEQFAQIVGRKPQDIFF